jgi:hypothetical protein
MAWRSKDSTHRKSTNISLFVASHGGEPIVRAPGHRHRPSSVKGVATAVLEKLQGVIATATVHQFVLVERPPGVVAVAEIAYDGTLPLVQSRFFPCDFIKASTCAW